MILKEACPDGIVDFLESAHDVTSNLQSKLQSMAPKMSSISTHICTLQRKIANLRSEELKWKDLNEQQGLDDIPLDPPPEATMPLLTESEISQMGIAKQKLILQVRHGVPLFKI